MWKKPIVPEQFTAEVVRNDDGIWWHSAPPRNPRPDRINSLHAAASPSLRVPTRYSTKSGRRLISAAKAWSSTMRYLSSLALESDVEQGLLIAGVEGQALYSYLGWTAIGDVVVLGHPDVDPKDQWATQTFEP